MEMEGQMWQRVGWCRVDGEMDIDLRDGGFDLVLGEPQPDDSYPTLSVGSVVGADGGIGIRVVGDKEMPFTMGPRIATGERAAELIEPDHELVLGSNDAVELSVGRLASRTHVALQRHSGNEAAVVTVRDLNSKHGTYLRQSQVQ